MAIFPEGDIYMCQCMEQNQVRMGNILIDSYEKILKTQDYLLKQDEIKKLFCVDNKEICKKCDYRYICGGKCMASKSEYDYKCTYAKAMFKYVLFYYQPKDKKSENLEKYVQYLEKIKKTTKRDGKSI